MEKEPKKEEKVVEKLKPGFLSASDFKLKYDTNYKQIHPESFLDEVSDEDREMYPDGEILTGKSKDGKFNTWNNFAVRNPLKPRDTVQIRMINSFKRTLDDSLENGDMDLVFQRLINSSKRGDFRMLKYLMDRALGKEVEQLEIKTDGNVNIKLNIPPKFKKNEKNDK